MSTVSAWFSAARPKTLTASFAPIVAATALASAEGHSINGLIVLFTLMSATAIQIATNFFNDYLDVTRGVDDEARLGPRRALHEGTLSAAHMRRGAVVCLAIALMTGLPLVVHGGVTILIIGISSLALAYLYTGGPLPLSSNGLGDLFVLLFFGIIATCGTFLLHAGHVNVSAIIMGVQIGCLATSLIVINNVRDRESDAAHGKMTLAVLLGPSASRVEFAALLAMPYVLHFAWIQYSFFAFMLPLLTAPLAYHLVSRILRDPPSLLYNVHLARAALLHSLFGMSLAVGLMLR